MDLQWNSTISFPGQIKETACTMYPLLDPSTQAGEKKVFLIIGVKGGEAIKKNKAPPRRPERCLPLFPNKATRLSWPLTGFRPVALRHRLSTVLPFRIFTISIKRGNRCLYFVILIDHSIDYFYKVKVPSCTARNSVQFWSFLAMEVFHYRI